MKNIKMKELQVRENKNYEVQWYDKDGNEDPDKGARVVQFDNTVELCQYLARVMWGSMRFDNNPTVWLNGKRWCFCEFSDPIEVNTILEKEENS